MDQWTSNNNRKSSRLTLINTEREEINGQCGERPQKPTQKRKRGVANTGNKTPTNKQRGGGLMDTRKLLEVVVVAARKTRVGR